MILQISYRQFNLLAQFVSSVDSLGQLKTYPMPIGMKAQPLGLSDTEVWLLEDESKTFYDSLYIL